MVAIPGYSVLCQESGVGRERQSFMGRGEKRRGMGMEGRGGKGKMGREGRKARRESKLPSFVRRLTVPGIIIKVHTYYF